MGDNKMINGIILTPLKKILHPKGDVLHGMKKSDNGYIGFGEVYFSTINGREIKGWKKHTRMTLNLIVPVGEVIFIVYDDREMSPSKGIFFKVKLSPDNYKRLTVPPGLWMAFKGNNNYMNLILNLADIEHSSEEIENLNLNQIEFDWETIDRR